MSAAPRVAIVHDWLDTWRGGENVLAEIIGVYPDADLFALVDFLPEPMRPRLLGKRAATSFLQRIPGARPHFRALLPLFPRAVESLDVSRYELVISSSHAVAKGVRTLPSQLHVCYCHTPMRYAWDLREHYLAAHDLGRGARGLLTRRVLDRLRNWDLGASARVQRFVANSAFVRDRIRRCYGRDATVIHPPVDVDFYTLPEAPVTPARRDYYVTASRWVPYKRVDLVVEAFRQLPEQRLVVVGDGPEARRVRAAAGDNVTFVGEVSRERLRELLRNARAFVFAAEEDFGILPVEAQACGTPVIAYGAGGALETVRAAPAIRPTGVFFDHQSADAIAAALLASRAFIETIDPLDCRRNAGGFEAGRFRTELKEVVEEAWADFLEKSRRVP